MPFARNYNRRQYNPRGYGIGRANNRNTSSGSPMGYRKGYGSLQSSRRRHELTTTANFAGASIGDYTTLDLCRMVRSFGSGDDEPPTPTSSNNFQTQSVMNGSHVQDLEAVVRLSNKDTNQGIYIDVYALNTSFFTALNSQVVNPTESPLEFVTDVTDDIGDMDSFS